MFGINKKKTINSFICICLLILAEFYDDKITYILFLFLCINTIYAEGIRKNSIWKLVVYSIILPDNYVIIVLADIVGIITLIKAGKYAYYSKKQAELVGILVLLATFSTIINGVPVVNILFSILFFLTIILSIFMLNSPKLLEVSCNIGEAIDKVYDIEIVAVLLGFIHCLIRGKFGDDWAVGTLGSAQQVQVFLIAFIGGIIECAKIENNKSVKGKKNMRLLAMMLVVIATNCWSQLLVSVLVLGVFWLLQRDKKVLVRIVVFTICLVCIFPFVINMIPRGITSQITNMIGSKEYREYRFPKLGIYYKTYVEIPSEDALFLLLGNGVGNYASRAALTCTGYYISGYSTMFEASMSDYTEKYILPALIKSYYNSGGDSGSVLARPYSSFIALMGELGITGLVLVFLIVKEIMKKQDKYGRGILLLWLASCFLENYFEYAKIIVLVMLSMGICKCLSLKRE